MTDVLDKLAARHATGRRRKPKCPRCNDRPTDARLLVSVKAMKSRDPRESGQALVRLSARTVVETDMCPFEGALDEDWCHRGGRPCGAPPSRGRHFHYGWSTPHGHVTPDGRCSVCSRPVCPDCRDMVRRGDA